MAHINSLFLFVFNPLQWFMRNLYRFPGYDGDSSQYEDITSVEYGPLFIQIRECFVMDVDTLEISLFKLGYRWTQGDDRDALGRQGWFKRAF